MRILVVFVGTLRGSPFEDDAAHYERLLGRHARLEVEEVKEARGDARRKADHVEREAEALLRRVPERCFVCALDREGDQLSSVEIARFLEQRRQSGQDLCFVVGGPFGLGAGVKSRADSLLALGRITLPHQLARIVLLEQLFRAHKILGGEPYHY